MSVFVEKQGQGRPLVLLHGWGTNGRIWLPLAERIASDFTLYLVDLPGHGRSAADGPFRLDDVARAVESVVPPDAVWVGWSLGGLVSLAAASQSASLRALVLTGTNPRFTTAADWPHATPPNSLDQFADGLVADWESTLRRFLALQSRGSAQSRQEIRFLRSQLFAHGKPDPNALRCALDVLRNEDLRARLPGITIPALVVQGGRDALVPLGAAEQMAASLPQATLVTIPTAAHAPFLSHSAEFAEHLREFLDG